jgi:uncharacterized membrane protein YgcG
MHLWIFDRHHTLCGLKDAAGMAARAARAGGLVMKVNIWSKRVLTSLMTCGVALAMSSSPYAMAAFGVQDQQAPYPAPEQGPPPAPGQQPPAGPEQPPPAQLSPQQLQELVAPIALYPDALVAQILAASAYPTQIVEADRFLQQNPNLQGAALGAEVDKQYWDPSVKALTQFPSVLANMDKDLTWTSELGDANYNQPQDVMAAIQFMRQKAEQAGNLKSTPQQTVTNQGSTVVIQPANPQVVYVPEYNPELVYGYPVGLWPGFYPWWGISGPFISFGIGFGIGPFFGFGWGWPAWGFHWGFGGGMWYHGGRYAFHSHAFYNRNAYFHGNYRGASPFARGDRGLRGYGPAGRSFAPRAGARSFAPSARAGSRSFAPAGRAGTRSFTQSARSRTRSGAFGGISRGGDARSFSARGRSSLGGGSHGGGGGRR